MLRGKVLAALGLSLMAIPIGYSQQTQPAAEQKQPPTTQAPAQSQAGNPPDDAAVREAAKAAAAEAERQQFLKNQDQAIADDLHALHSMTPEERTMWQRRFFPDFRKKVGELNQTSAAILSVASHGPLDEKAQKEIEKRSRTLESSAGWIINYLLAGGDAPVEPEVTYSSLPLPERVWVLKYSVPPIVERILQSHQGNTAVVDAKSEQTLIQDLQSVRLLGRSLRP